MYLTSFSLGGVGGIISYYKVCRLKNVTWSIKQNAEKQNGMNYKEKKKCGKKTGYRNGKEGMITVTILWCHGKKTTGNVKKKCRPKKLEPLVKPVSYTRSVLYILLRRRNMSPYTQSLEMPKLPPSMLS